MICVEKAFENDIKIFEQIINNTKAISKVYERLIYLDSSEEKDTDDYNALIIILNDLIDEEQKLYKKLNLDREKDNFIWNHLIKSNQFEYIEDGLFSTCCNENTSDIWFFRIFNRLKEFKEVYDKEDIQIISEEYTDPLELVEYLKEKKLRDFIDNDFQRAFIYLLEEDINKCDNYCTKDYFVRAKYNLLFVSPMLENDLLENNFHNKKDFYFYFPFVADVMKLDNNYKKEIQSDEAYNNCMDSIEGLKELLELGDDIEEFQDTTFKILSVYFRTGLSLLYNQKDYEEIISDIVSNVTGDEEDERIVEIIDDALIKTDNDKVKCKYLSKYS